MTNGLPREEADAKFEALEARLETRLTQLDAKIDQRFLTLDTKIDQRFLTLDAKFDLMLLEIRHVGDIAVEARTAARSIKWNMLFASLGTLGVTLSMVFALWTVGYQIADFMRPH